MSNRQLTIKQKRWADEYFASGNATQAAILAGYSERSAGSIATENLQKPTIAEYLSQLRNKEHKKTMSRRDKIIAEAEKIAFANIARFTRLDENGRRVIDFSQATEEDLAALTSIKTKTRHVYTPKGEHVATEHADQFVMADKLRGLEFLGKVEGMFQDNELKVTVDVADRLLAARQRYARIENGTEKQSDDDDE